MPTTIEVAQQFFASVGARDLPAIESLFAEQFEWRVPGNFPWSGLRTEKAHIVSFFQTMWPMMVEGKSDILDAKMIVEGNDAAMFATFRHTVAKTGKAFTAAVAFNLVVDDGKIVHLNMVEDTMAVAEAFQFD
jgi:uncharacterized protein